MISSIAFVLVCFWCSGNGEMPPAPTPSTNASSLPFGQDIPDINSFYKGRKTLDELSQPVRLENGTEVQLHDRGDLTFFAGRKRHLLDMIADDNGLQVFPHSSLSTDTDSPYFAGDVLLTASQIGSVVGHFERALTSRRLRRRKRSIHVAPQQNWPRTIRYEFDADVAANGQLKEAIEQAMAWWTQSTCLSFEKGIPNGYDHGWLLFTRRGRCASFVGMIGGRQPLHVGPGCEQPGIVAHLLGHALGLWHEHQRHDRDDQLYVKWENVMTQELDAFVACDNCPERLNIDGDRAATTTTTTTRPRYGSRSTGCETCPAVDWSITVPYDAGSIMHSKITAFSSNSKPTLGFDDADLERTFGAKREGPSFYDVLQINRKYCSDQCTTKKEPRHGYWNPSYGNCSVPVCSDGHYGPTCNWMINGVPTHCGGFFYTTANSVGAFNSPLYPQPMKPGQKCNFVIKAPEGSVVHMRFSGIFEFPDTEPCDYNYVEVRTSKDMNKAGYRFCGNIMPNTTFVSEHQKMYVMIRSTDNSTRSRGFNATFWSERAPQTVPITTTPKSKDDPFPDDCKDRLPLKRCVERFFNKDRCDSPKGRRLCTRTCGHCVIEGETTTHQPSMCVDELEPHMCIEHFLAKGHCNKWRAQQRCRQTCGSCTSEDPCELQNQFCNDLPPPVLMQKPVRDWCDRCPGFTTPPTTTRPPLGPECGGTVCSAKSRCEVIEKTDCGQQECPPEFRCVPEEDDCVDEADPSVCLFIVLAQEQCNTTAGHRCRESCGLCHPFDGNVKECRLQRRFCPSQSDAVPDGQFLCLDDSYPPLRRWCDRCEHVCDGEIATITEVGGENIDGPAGQAQKTEPQQICRSNPCDGGQVCVAEPKVCEREPCLQYRCEDPRLTSPPTTREWRAVTDVSDESCRDDEQGDQGAFCLSEVLGPYNCQTDDRHKCKETCRLCSTSDPCRLQKERCWDGVLCRAGGHFETWCAQCGECMDSDGEQRDRTHTGKGHLEPVDQRYFMFF